MATSSNVCVALTLGDNHCQRYCSSRHMLTSPSQFTLVPVVYLPSLRDCAGRADRRESVQCKRRIQLNGRLCSLPCASCDHTKAIRVANSNFPAHCVVFPFPGTWGYHAASHDNEVANAFSSSATRAFRLLYKHTNSNRAAFGREFS
jgi:hypothetical protein